MRATVPFFSRLHGGAIESTDMRVYPPELAEKSAMLFAFGQRRRLAHRLQYLDLGLLSLLLYEIAGGFGMNFAVGLSAGGLRVPILERGFVAYLQKKKLDESGEWSVETEEIFMADLASLLVV